MGEVVTHLFTHDKWQVNMTKVFPISEH